jgi:hypothetical protein
MSPDLLRGCLDARPFASFLLYLSDGSDHRVDSPSDAKLTPDGSAMEVTQNGHRMFVALNQIVSIHMDSRSGTGFGFGPRPRQ